jgi:hypothetical protein
LSSDRELCAQAMLGLVHDAERLLADRGVITIKRRAVRLYGNRSKRTGVSSANEQARSSERPVMILRHDDAEYGVRHCRVLV